MAGYPMAKKWVMVYNEKLQEWQQAKKALGADRISMLPGSSAAMSTSGSSEGTPQPDRHSFAHSILQPDSKINVLRGKTESPDGYLRKFIDGSVTPAVVSSLTVGLRTYEIAWVKEFIDIKGLSVLTNALANLTRLPQPLKESDIKLELEILKCLKTLLNVKVRPQSESTMSG